MYRSAAVIASETSAALDALTFGVEIEAVGATRQMTASILARALGLDPRFAIHCVGGYYDKWAVTMADGRVWTCMTDGSISRDRGTEVVSPILQGEADMELLQTVVRAMRAAGMVSDVANGCGIHVHVGVRALGADAVGRLAVNVSRLDAFCRAAFGTSPSREMWCAPLSTPTVRVGHVADVKALARARSFEALARAWYGSASAARDARAEHYHGSRYHGLNLHSVFYADRGTAEFRFADGTLHAGKIRAFVTLALALVAASAAGKVVRRAPSTDRRSIVATLWTLGLVGSAPRFKNVVQHLVDAAARREAARAA